jgi:hypothetical protein
MAGNNRLKKKIKSKPVRDSKENNMPEQKATLETAPLWTVHLLDGILSEMRTMNKLLKKALTE